MKELAKQQKRLEKIINFKNDEFQCISKFLNISNKDFVFKIKQYLHKICNPDQNKSFTKSLEYKYKQNLQVFKTLLQQFGQDEVYNIIHSVTSDEQFIQFIRNVNWNDVPIYKKLVDMTPTGVGRGELLLQVVCKYVVISGQSKDFDITYTFDDESLGKFQVKFEWPVRIGKDSRYLKTMRAINYMISSLDQRKEQILKIVADLNFQYLTILFSNLYKYMDSNFISMQLSVFKSQKFKLLTQYICCFQSIQHSTNEELRHLFHKCLQDQTYIEYVKNFKSFEEYLNNQLQERVSNKKQFLFFNNGKIVFTDQIIASSITGGTVKIEPKIKQPGIYIRNQKIKEKFKI